MPEYTGDLLPGKPYTVSSSYPGYPVTNAFDNNDATRWLSQIAPNPWMRIDFVTGVRICKIVIRVDGNYQPTVILQGSNNDVDWTNVYTLTNMLSTTTYTFEFTNNIDYRYYRLYGQNNYYFSIYTLRMYAYVTYKLSGTYISNAIDATTIPDSAISWSANLATGTAIDFEYAFNMSDIIPPTSWLIIENNGPFIMPEILDGYFLWIKATLSTSDIYITPTLITLAILQKTPNINAIQINLSYAGRLKYPQGNVNVLFTGQLVGIGGAMIASFSEDFIPTELVLWFKPNDPEYITASIYNATLNVFDINYISTQNGDEYIKTGVYGATIATINVGGLPL